MFRLISLRFLESYFRHRWLYLLPIALMAVAAMIFVMISKPKYVANGILFVQKESLLAKLTSVTGNDVTWQTPAAATVGEIKELIQTDAFLRAVIQQTDLEAEMGGGQEAVRETIDKVREEVWTSNVGDNQVLVAASSEKPQVAYQLAKATINTFIQWKINADISESDAAHKFFSMVSVRYKAEVDQARQALYDYLNQHPEPVKGERPPVETLEIAKLQAALTSAETRYVSALEKDENAQLAAAQTESNVRQSYIVIDAPLMPDKSTLSRSDLAIQIAVFLVVGVILSLLGVAGNALLDRTFRFPVDVWHGVNLPVLTMVPDFTPRPEKTRRKSKIRLAEADDSPELTEIGGALLTATEAQSSPDEAANSPAIEQVDTPLSGPVAEITTVDPQKKQKLTRKQRRTHPAPGAANDLPPKPRIDSSSEPLLKTSAK